MKGLYLPIFATIICFCGQNPFADQVLKPKFRFPFNKIFFKKLSLKSRNFRGGSVSDSELSSVENSLLLSLSEPVEITSKKTVDPNFPADVDEPTDSFERFTVRPNDSPKRNLSIRPPVSKDFRDLEFQLFDVDYSRSATSGADQDFVIHAFGTTEEGFSVHVSLRGFLPYFFVNIPRKFEAEECKAFIAKLNIKMKAQSRSSELNKESYLRALKASSVERKSILGYSRKSSWFLQIFCPNPESVRRAAMILRHWDASFDLPALFPKGPAIFHIFEANVDPVTRLSSDTKIVISGWVRLVSGKFKRNDSFKKQSSCDIDATADIEALSPVEKHTVAPFLIGSFDIECVPEGGRGFPDPNKPLDQCVQIGTAVYRFGEDLPVVNIVLALNSVAPVDGLEIRQYRTERELLLAWRDLIVHELDLDLLVGHNIFKFDLCYLARRARVLNVPEFFLLGRLCGQLTTLKTKETISKAYGHNEFHYLTMQGRMQMDVYQVIKKEHKLSSYKLDSMSKHFLKDEKDNVSPKEIFAFQSKDAHHRAIVAKYCAKDCELVWRLLRRLDILPQYIEMSKVTGVTLNDLNTRGQQIKVFTQIIQEAHSQGFIVPEIKIGAGSDEMQYQGAFVLQPKSGLYQEPIATLDFASLYPSIIRGDNLSYETLVEDPLELDRETPVSHVKVEQCTIFDAQITISKGSSQCIGAKDNLQYARLLAFLSQELRKKNSLQLNNLKEESNHGDNKEGVGKPILSGIQIMFGTAKKTATIDGPCYRVCSVQNGIIELHQSVHHLKVQRLTVKRVKVIKECEHLYVQHVEGILPRICKNLLEARKKAKEEMSATDDPVKRGLLNGKQLALKISCNSVYGFTGAVRGMLPCVAIASSVTAIGQQMIKTTKKTVEENFNSTVIYGDTDSVMVNFHLGEGPQALVEALRMGKIAAALVTSKFKPPNELQFEKVYMPYILYSKKRYAGQMYTKPESPDKIDIKGLQVVRRDNSQLSRDVMKAIINCLVSPIRTDELLAFPGLSKVDVTKKRIAELITKTNDELINGNISWEKFIISQSISKKGYDVKNIAGHKSASIGKMNQLEKSQNIWIEDCLPGHVKLAERMELREPGTGPVTGDRVPFVVVKEAPHLKRVRNRTIAGVTYAAKDWPPRHERCEDPAYAKEMGMTIDREYYLQNQLKNPVLSLLEPVYPEACELFLDAQRKLNAITSRNTLLTSFFKPMDSDAI